MKIVKHNVHLVFSVIFFLITFVSWGQTAAIFSGGGTGSEKDPYVILTKDDWNKFAESVNNGYTYSGEYVKLGRDIGSEEDAINEIVATCILKDGGDPHNIDDYYGYKFDGNFDGAWHTIYVYLDQEHDYVAPFGWVNAASISNLTVEGTISGGYKYYGGIVGCIEDEDDDPVPIKLTNCTSRVEIKRKAEGKAKEEPHHGGLVGWLSCGRLIFENCIFEGSITGDANNCAGFVGIIEKWKDSDYVNVMYKNCTQAHDEIEPNDKITFGTFHLPNVDTLVLKPEGQLKPWETAYCIHRIKNEDGKDDNQGTLAPEKVPDDVISKIYKDKEHGTFYVPYATAIPELDSEKHYMGTIPVKYYGRRLNDGEDYTITSEDGGITITGSGDYAGEVGFKGIDFKSFSKVLTWANLNDELKKVTGTVDIILDKSYEGGTGTVPLTIANTVVLDLNGYTLDRKLYDPKNPNPQSNGYVIKVPSTANLTIKDSSVGSFGCIKGGCTLGQAGGIYNEGTLTVESGNICYNYCKRSGGGIYGLGGGVYNKGKDAHFIMTGGSISHNIGDGGGGGFYSEGYCSVSGGIVSYNVTDSKGGGIRVLQTKGADATVLIENCDIIGNKLNMDNDAADGGGLYNAGVSGVILRNCNIIGNKAKQNGGGIYLMDNGDITLENCKIIDNTSITQGGGIYIYGGRVSLVNTTIAENTSNSVGGVFVRSGQNLWVSGNTEIYKNIGDARKCNVYLDSSGDKLTITGNLNVNKYIGLARKDKNPEDDITSGFGKYSGKDAIKSDDYTQYWFDTEGDELIKKKTLQWGVEPGWSSPSAYTQNEGHYTVKAPVIIKSGTKVNVKSITLTGQGKIFITEGGQLTCTNQEKDLEVTVIKVIDAAPAAGDDGKQYGWYTIASPVNNPKIGGYGAGTNLITAYVDPYNFDFLRWHESQFDFNTHYPGWEIYNAQHANGGDFTRMENGRGFMYRNKSKIEVEYVGNINTGEVVCDSVFYTESLKENAGWNLLGNPYTHYLKIKDNIKFYDAKDQLIDKQLTGYYVLTKGSTWGSTVYSDIKLGQGFLVQVPEGTAKVRFTETKSKDDDRANREFVKFIVNNDEYEDAAYALYDEGYGLRKIEHLNPKAQMLYINYDGEDYAVATLTDDVKTFNLNFRSMTAGQYTLKYETQGEFDYLHVYDKLTGRDIDMLANEEYKFISSPKDTDSRFVVNLKYKPNYNVDGSGTFAYQEGEDILVTGEGHLQMFDVAGRMIVNKRLNGVERISVAAKGVYILKLNEKTQKIVVR